MEEVNSKEKSLIVNKIVGGLMFSVFGFMGFFYCLWRQNYNAAAWCLLLDLACVLLLTLNKSYLRLELHLKCSIALLRILKYASLLLGFGGLCAFATYIALAILWKEELDEKTHYAAAAVAFMASFWYFVLFFDLRKFQIILE